MSYDDPEYLACTCTNRALRPDEMVLYAVPHKSGKVKTHVFAKDCPVHGYSVIPASEDAEIILTE